MRPQLRRDKRGRAHGRADNGSSEYEIWTNLKQRCFNPKHPSFHNYGARGITVCPAWMTYSNFLADMGRRPSARHSIERKDNNKGYSPGNCVWATPFVQSINTRRTRLTQSKVDRIRLLLELRLCDQRELAKMYGVHPTTIWFVIHRWTWA